MGRTQLADEFYKRSQNYRNVFNPASSFMQPIDDKGIFQPNFSPDDYTAHICESNGWQYFWSVQQDIKGLIALTGGKDRFTESWIVCLLISRLVMQICLFSVQV